MKELARIVIPNYIKQVKLSQKQRPVYFQWDGNTIKAKSKKLYQKYIGNKEAVINNYGNVLPQHLTKDVAIFEFKGTKCIGKAQYAIDGEIETFPFVALTEKQKKTVSKFILCDIQTQEPILANETKVGKPRYQIIKGQDIYNGKILEHTRAKIMNEIKESFLPYIEDFSITEYPIKIHLELHDTVKNQFDRTKDKNSSGIRWDLGNRVYPYMKAMPDLLQVERKLIEDDRLHITGESYEFIPIEEDDIPKLVFIFFKDERDCIKNNRFYEQNNF